MDPFARDRRPTNKETSGRFGDYKTIVAASTKLIFGIIRTDEIWIFQKIPEPNLQIIIQEAILPNFFSS